MFSVIFEVLPNEENRDDYLDNAKILRSELELEEGFIDNIRYKSLTREGWILSLSNWRDEKALVRWRTRARHHEVQEYGRFEVFRDYHLRVGEITRDTRLPAGQVLREQRLDETVAGAATRVMLVNVRHPPDWAQGRAAEEVAQALGLSPGAAGLVAWDVFEAVLSPGDTILLMSWRDRAAAEAYAGTTGSRHEARLREIRVVRDYRMFDRREAPQFYPDVKGAPTRHV